MMYRPNRFSAFKPAALAALALACAFGLGGSLLPAAQAAPPAQKNQAPGYYRMALGDLEITALYDGYVTLDQKTLKGMAAKDIQALLARMFISTTKGMQTAVNAYLVNTGANLVLIDTGAAQCFGPTLGGILNNLRAAGYKAEDVDAVLLTHLHADHACRLVDNGKAVFPNATVWAAKDETAFWLSEEVAAKAPQDKQAAFKMSRDSVAPYAAAGKLKTFVAGDTPIPGVTIAPSPGHTPGHSGYLFASQGQSLLIWGDIVHNYAVQFPHPEVAFSFDVDEKQAVATRKRILVDAAKNKLWIAGAHLPFPGLGHVRTEKHGYAWVPVEYGPYMPAGQ
ncbi:MAG: MBL fold metallo-hydrolase [Zoogloeaceae bacterium]|jgi:glyoxylase-like metal-dependent hydrolase (beta-lactamase superfamily II)|nr:MBL fold metallo-hydrolase [Zoogloeaceae bacterium]